MKKRYCWIWIFTLFITIPIFAADSPKIEKDDDCAIALSLSQSIKFMIDSLQEDLKRVNKLEVKELASINPKIKGLVDENIELNRKISGFKIFLVMGVVISFMLGVIFNHLMSKRQ